MPTNPELVFVLVSLRSLFNVGALFRTADAVGASKIYLCGYTGTPAQSKVAKTALGAQDRVAWEKVASASRLIAQLKTDGFEIVALETGEKSQDFRAWKPKHKTAILLGNEVTGLSPRILSQADLVVHLPMAGIKESLNVAVAGGAIAYYWLSQTTPYGR